MYFKLCFYIASATNVFLSSILDIPCERGIPHQISPSTYHPWLHGNRFSCKSCITKFPAVYMQSPTSSVTSISKSTT